MANDNAQFTVDPELFQGFLDDSLESLSTLEPIFIDLEANPGNLDVIDDVFRPVHSIKGNAAFFELTQVNNFAHRLETLLDKIRKKEITANHAIVGILLKGVDELKAMLTRIANEEPEVVDEASTEALAKQIDAAAEGASLEDYAEHLYKQVDVVLAVIRESDSEALSPEISTELQTLEQINQAMAEIFAENHAEDASEDQVPDAEANYFYNDTDVTEEMLKAQGLLGKPAGEMTEEMIKELLGSLEELQKKVGEQANEIANAMLDDYHTMMSCAVGYDDLLHDLLKENLDKATALLKKKAEAETQTTDSPSSTPAASKPAEGSGSGASQGRTMRIAEEKVDDFMKYVGELIMISDSLDFLEEKLIESGVGEKTQKEFHLTNVSFRTLSDKLQNSLLEIRKVPARGLTQRIPRMVRDLCEKLGKDIQVKITGDSLSIDKTLMEALGDPVTHLVRNCLDHGIGTPDERESAGKPRTGTITIELEQNGDEVIFSIKDDGRGIDPDIIRDKAIEKGLLNPNQASSLDKDQILQYIFEPGFSTAATISDVSGRGVGMDVVRTNVEGLNGTIEINSEMGIGTEIRLVLPANTTVVVVTCILVGVGNNHFLIPLENIKELIRPGEDAVTMIPNQGEVLKVRDRLYPLTRLHDLFNVEPQNRKLEDGLVLMVESDHKEGALYVDQVFGQQRVVIKELQGELESLEGITGAALLSDSRIGIIVNIEDILKKNSAVNA